MMEYKCGLLLLGISAELNTRCDDGCQAFVLHIIQYTIVIFDFLYLYTSISENFDFGENLDNNC